MARYKDAETKKLESTFKEGLDIEDEDEKMLGREDYISKVSGVKDSTGYGSASTRNPFLGFRVFPRKKLEEMKAEFEPLTKLMKEAAGSGILRTIIRLWFQCFTC